MKNPLLIASLALVTLLSAQPAFSHESQAVAPLLTKKPIPKGFKTYSLFLICNPQWLDPQKNGSILQLYSQFQSFGRAIGEDHVAVWFWKSSSYEHSDAALAQVVDVERSVRFCRAWKLLPSEGPHLVITSTYPDESDLTSGLPLNNCVYKLGNMSPADISSLLARLTDQLVVNGRVEHHDAGPPTPPPGLWVRLLNATQEAINSFGCAWSFKINAGPVTADLKSCANH